jgi:diketogulonate reductase-like aldo/keto reductase
MVKASAGKAQPMRLVSLRTGQKVPALGIGTWHMGERREQRSAEIRAISGALDLGLNLIDTAEMYGEGGAEEVVAEALTGRRDKVYLVSKVYPHNASRKGTVAACERSLKRLRTDRLDLYLLHWPGSHPLAETVAAFEALQAAGKIRSWGVSNFDVGDLTSLLRVADGGNCLSNQILYHLGSRGVEWRLLDLCREKHMMVMAYSPLGQGPLLRAAALKALARKHGCDAGAIALAFLLRSPGVVAIPKASQLAHLEANVRALDVTLDAEDLAALDAAFPPPKRATPLAMT